MPRTQLLTLVGLAITALLSWPAIVQTAAPPTAPAVSEEEAYEIGVEAYLYTYPLVLMDVTRRQATNYAEPTNEPGRGPANHFSHMRTYPPAGFKDVARVNFDTLYSMAWLDLTQEPMIVSVPDTGGRYYLLPMLDMWSEVFAVVGSRTTGTQPGHFAVTGPGWKGHVPEGLQTLAAPTPYVWIMGRTLCKGAADYANVHPIQDGYRVTPLSQWGKKPAPVKGKVAADIDAKTPPPKQVAKMTAAAYYKDAAELLKVNRPHFNDHPILARMKQIGWEAGKDFDLSKADAHIRKALERAAQDAPKLFNTKVRTMGAVRNGWQMWVEGMGTYGTDYLRRATVAFIGLGANLPADAVYPTTFVDADGRLLSGRNKYVLHFNKEDLPPARAFWSVTLYDMESHHVANRLNRFAIGDRDKLHFNSDDSLDLYLQHESPGADEESNWLPAPTGFFNLTMRLYNPKMSVLDGTWAPPGVKRVK